MNVIIIFDVDSHLEELKAALRKKGFYTTWKSNEKRYNLPKSTMWKPDATLQGAQNEFNNTIAELLRDKSIAIKLERLLVLSASPWSGIEGIPIAVL